MSYFVAPWLYWLIVPIHRLFIRWYFHSIQITGQEHLPPDGPVILACKHYSRWDPLIIATLSVEPLRFMTNANQFGGVQGWFIKRLGGFPVDVSRPQPSTLRHAVALLHAQKKLVMFPEGGIVRDQPLRSLKLGLARLVLQAEATAPTPLRIPIVPIAIRYQPDAQWGATIYLHISPPLYSHGRDDGQAAMLNPTDRDEKHRAQTLTDQLTQALLAGLHEIAQR